jgi:hypothetical protein
MKYIFLLILLTGGRVGFSQAPDSIYTDYVKTPQLFGYGNQLTNPVIHLNSNEKLELHFDDINADIKNYYYTYQLCNADWTPTLISQFDYIRGFSQVNISSYKYSSFALTHYTHYQAIIPDVNCIPSRSGNYLLKVFLDGDTSKLVFTRRFLVLGDGVAIAAQILLPFNPAISNSDQKLQFNINIKALNVVNPFQQLKVVLLQNNRWDIAITGIQPSFYSGSNYQYNSDDNCNFPAGKEWRWLDLQSFRFQSDRVLRADYLKTSTTIFVRPDPDRSQQAYYYSQDLDGNFYIQTTESINPLWQGDYANVRFSFVPPGNIPFPDKDVYLSGKITDYKLNDLTKMIFNADRGVYEGSLFLKQGYYNYCYVTVNKDDPSNKPTFDFTEGNVVQAENDYTILVYFRELGGRADQLVGMATLNSMTSR